MLDRTLSARETKGKHGLRRFHGLLPKPRSEGGREDCHTGEIVGQITKGEMLMPPGRTAPIRSFAHVRGTCAMGGVKGGCQTCKAMHAELRHTRRTRRTHSTEATRFSAMQPHAPSTPQAAAAEANHAARVIQSGRWWKVFNSEGVWVVSRCLPLGVTLGPERGVLIDPSKADKAMPWKGHTGESHVA